MSWTAGKGGEGGVFEAVGPDAQILFRSNLETCERHKRWRRAERFPSPGVQEWKWKRGWRLL